MSDKINSIDSSIEEKNTTKDSDAQKYMESVQEDIHVLVNEQQCPNCEASMYAWKCENIETCWYWHWDDHIKKIIEKKEQKSEKLSESLTWNGQKYELTTLSGEIFYFYNYYWRIESDKANIQIEANWKKLKMNILYNLVENDDIKQISSIRFVWKIKKLEAWEWKDIYINYRELKKYISIILLDNRFNKTL